MNNSHHPEYATIARLKRELADMTRKYGELQAQLAQKRDSVSVEGIDTVAIRKAAKRATPGPWFYDPNTMNSETDCLGEGSVQSDYWYLFKVERLDYGIGKNNGNYIATMHPQATIALLDRIEELENQLERLKSSRCTWTGKCRFKQHRRPPMSKIQCPWCGKVAEFLPNGPCFWCMECEETDTDLGIIPKEVFNRLHELETALETAKEESKLFRAGSIAWEKTYSMAASDRDRLQEQLAAEQESVNELSLHSQDLQQRVEELGVDRDRLQESLDALQKIYQKSVDRTMDYMERVEKLERNLEIAKQHVIGWQKREQALRAKVEDNDKWFGEFQNRVRDSLIKAAKKIGIKDAELIIDGSGSDGDEYHFTETEIRQFIEHAVEVFDKRRAQIEGAVTVGIRKSCKGDTVYLVDTDEITKMVKRGKTKTFKLLELPAQESEGRE